MEKLTKISLSVTLLGLWILLLILNFSPPLSLEIQDITNETLDKQVILSVNITNVKTFPNSTFQIITLKDKTGEINAVLNNKYALEKASNVIIKGKVQEYNNTLQIQTQKINHKD